MFAGRTIVEYRRLTDHEAVQLEITSDFKPFVLVLDDGTVVVPTNRAETPREAGTLTVLMPLNGDPLS